MINKLTISLLFVSSTFLSAAVMQEAQSAFDKNEYAQTVKLLRQDVSGYADVNHHILWGQAQEALGNDDQALSAYERALMIDNSNVDVMIALARLYKKVKMDDDAGKLINDLSTYVLSPAQRSALSNLGSKKESLNNFRASAGISTGYDSNVNASAGAGNLDAYYQDLGLNVLTTDVAGSGFVSYKANASYVHELGEAKGFYAQGDANFYGQNNFSASDFDTYYGRASAGMGYKYSDYSVYVPLAYDRVYYLERDLLQTYAIAPILNAVLNKNLLISTGFKYQIRRYINENDSSRDDNVLGVNAALIGVMGKSLVYLKGSLEEYSAQENATFVEKTLFSVMTGFTYNAGKGYSLGGNYRFRFAQFTDPVKPDSLLIRRDIYNSLNLNASKVFMKNFQATLDYKFIRNASNYVPADYNKNIMTLGLQYNY